MVSDKTRRWFGKLRRAALVFLLALIGILVIFDWIYPFNDARFDKDVWLHAKNRLDADNPRGPMAEDVMNNYLHKGMSRSAVRELLGQPDSTGEYDNHKDCDWYYLGMRGFMNIDGEWLIVEWGKNGTLESTDLKT